MTCDLYFRFQNTYKPVLDLILGHIFKSPMKTVTLYSKYQPKFDFHFFDVEHLTFGLLIFNINLSHNLRSKVKCLVTLMMINKHLEERKKFNRYQIFNNFDFCPWFRCNLKTQTRTFRQDFVYLPYMWKSYDDIYLGFNIKFSVN